MKENCIITIEKERHKKQLPPKDDDELPKAGMELPKAGDDEAPKAVIEEKGEEDWATPNTPVEVPLNIDPPVCEPKGVGLPKEGLGANRLLLALLVCPKTDWDANGQLDCCSKAV